MGLAITDTVIEAESRKRIPRKVRRIATDRDPTYGDQQLSFFDAFYDNGCYLHMITTIQFDDDPSVPA